MTYEVNGKTLEATENGYLVNADDWDKDVAQGSPPRQGRGAAGEHEEGRVLARLR